jgi:hypothetical protein
MLSKDIKIKIRGTIILIVFYMGVKLSFALREEHRLRVSENSGLRKIFGSKREEGTGGWGKLHIEEYHDSYPSPNIVRVIRSGKM